MTLRLGVALALAVLLGFALGFGPAVWLSGAIQAHTHTIVRVCWEQPVKGVRFQALLYRGDAEVDSVATVAKPKQ